MTDWAREALSIGARTEGSPLLRSTRAGRWPAARRFRVGTIGRGERSVLGLFGYPDTFHSPRVIGTSKRQVRLRCVLLRRAGVSARVAVFFRWYLCWYQNSRNHKPLKTSGIGRQ